jgi:hypothetical protein
MGRRQGTGLFCAHVPGRKKDHSLGFQGCEDS